MNVGQNGDPDDCVRFGYLRGLNGGEVRLLEDFGSGDRILMPVCVFCVFIIA